MRLPPEAKSFRHRYPPRRWTFSEESFSSGFREVLGYLVPSGPSSHFQGVAGGLPSTKVDFTSPQNALPHSHRSNQLMFLKFANPNKALGVSDLKGL